MVHLGLQHLRKCFIEACLVLDYKGMDCSYPEANLVGSWLTDTLLLNLLTKL
jgi:hypothetical protein